MAFRAEHRTRLASNRPLERLNGDLKSRARVVGIFSNAAAGTGLFAAISLEQNDRWAVERARQVPPTANDFQTSLWRWNR